MKKIITSILLIFLAFSSKAQEEFVVHGFLGTPSILPSRNFQRSMFCYFQGNYVISRNFSGHIFSIFRVESVMSGTFYDYNNEVKQPPFNIAVGLINEAVVLDFQQHYTLQVRRFPHTNYFYVDNLSQVYPNTRDLRRRLAEHNRRHQQNIHTLTNGTLYERRELLEKLQGHHYSSRYNDFRYIPYLLPYMTSKDSVAYYGVFNWTAITSTGQTTGGADYFESKGLYSDFLHNYFWSIRLFLPFALPDRMTTDSIGWHKWYENLLSQKICFVFVEYAESQREIIGNLSVRIRNPGISYVVYGIHYFIPDIPNRVIYFGSAWMNYVLNIDTNELTQTRELPGHRFFANDNFSIQNNEVPRYNFDEGINLYRLNNGVFHRQVDELIPLSFSLGFENVIIHSDNDFLVFFAREFRELEFQRPDRYAYLKAGKINRKGEWIIEPKILYRDIRPSNGNFNIHAFSFYQSDKNNTTFAFADRINSEIEENAGAIFVYRVNANLEKTDSVMFTMEFPHLNYHFTQTRLLKKDSTYLLLVYSTNSNHSVRLHYILLNNDLTPKTDFISLSNHSSRDSGANAIAASVSTSNGFLISWNDNDLAEHVTRSVLIDTSGNQSEIINISNQRIRNIFNIEFDENNVDIFIVDTDGNLIRKRIHKSEFGLCLKNRKSEIVNLK